MKCPNCNSEKWQSVDHLRFKEKKPNGEPQGMCICVDCGMVSYPSKWMTKDKILEHYRNDYRNPPSVLNAFTGQRKNYFHHAFLIDLFNEWKKLGITKPRVLEIGAAFGMTLDFVRQFFPDAEIYGTEITTSFKRNAMHEFGIKLDDDFDDTKKYDLIMTYKVLEHQLDPHLELERYSKCLSENGRLYISVPTWFNTMSNFGLDGFDLEYYYDPNHINVWTKNIFENILQRSGFDIIKEDHIMYGNTYLCAANTSKEVELYRENHLDIISKMEQIKKAFMSFTEQKYKDALDSYQNYPAAWVSFLEINRKTIAEKGWEYFHENFVKKALDACPNSPELFITATDFAMRAKDFETAISYAKKAFFHKPNNAQTAVQMINIFKEMAIRSQKEDEKIGYFKEAKKMAQHLLNTSLQHRDEAISQIYALNALIPL